MDDGLSRASFAASFTSSSGSSSLSFMALHGLLGAYLREGCGGGGRRPRSSSSRLHVVADRRRRRRPRRLGDPGLLGLVLQLVLQRLLEVGEAVAADEAAVAERQLDHLVLVLLAPAAPAGAD